jgi:hypothetical protein
VRIGSGVEPAGADTDAGVDVDAVMLVQLYFLTFLVHGCLQVAVALEEVSSH